MTSLEAQTATGLDAREIASPDYLSKDTHLTGIGDLFRYQLGRVVPHSVTVEETTDSGRVIKRTINTKVFELHAFGHSFEAAVSNLAKRK